MFPSEAAHRRAGRPVETTRPRAGVRDCASLQALCDIVHAGESDVGPAEVASVGGRIEVSLDHLFG